MKIILGTVILAASHVINAYAFVIPSSQSSLETYQGSDASSNGPLDGDVTGAESSGGINKRSLLERFRLPARRALWDHLVARSPQVAATGAPSPSASDSINLTTVVGTGPAPTASGTLASTVDNLSTSVAGTGLTTDPPAATATETESIITVTQTSIVIVTATVDPVPSGSVNVQNDAFGGTAGELNAASAPTGGAIVTIESGSDAFGGIVGAVTVVSGNGAFGGVVGAVVASSTDSVPMSTSTTLDGSTPAATGLVSAAETTATAPAGYNKRNAIEAGSNNLDDST
jgi:hypothetical protein